MKPKIQINSTLVCYRPNERHQKALQQTVVVKTASTTEITETKRRNKATIQKIQNNQ